MDTLLEKVKANLILTHSADDELLETYITAAVSYAESYQHIPAGTYSEQAMPPTTEQAVIMLASHFYESRDGSTGELERSLGLSPAKLNRDGNHDIKVGFAEPRSDGGSNAKLANILEYGKHGQPAKPFLKPAKTASQKECIEAMKAKLESEVDGL